MRTDPLPTFGYCLAADRVTLGFLQKASFPSLHVLVFEAPLFFDQRFLESMIHHGDLREQQWSLSSFDTSLRETGRVVWDRSRVTNLRFPSLTIPSSVPLRIIVQLSVTGVRDAEPTEVATAGTAANAAVGRRVDPLPFCLLQWTIDGIGSTYAVTKVDSFDVGDRSSNELVLTVSPDASADLFRDWLNSGNTPRAGTLRLLDSSLAVFYTIRFSGLRARNVVPAISLHASVPATVRLTYTQILFGKNNSNIK